MKVGINMSPLLKEKSNQLHIPFADLLRGFVIEDFLERVYTSEFSNRFWLINADAVGMESFQARIERPLLFFYAKSERNLDPARLLPGQKLSLDMMMAFTDAFFMKQTDVYWRVMKEPSPDFMGWQLEGEYFEMRVPLTVRIQEISESAGHPNKQTYVPFMDSSHEFEMYMYASEHQLGEKVYEIISKLELIADMEPYATANQILRSEPVSGRHIIEELTEFTAGSPKMRRIKRMEQLEEYMHYTYMRKRWQQYAKHHGIEEEWEDVLARILCFLRPIWQALCDNQVFFDDWMPELGRFLG